MAYGATPSLDGSDNYTTGNFSTRLYDGSPSFKFALDSTFAYLTDRGRQFTEVPVSGGKGYAWQGRAGYVLSLWHDAAEKQVPPELHVQSTDAVTRYDLFGNATAVPAGMSGQTLSSLPVYLVSKSPIKLIDPGGGADRHIEVKALHVPDAADLQKAWSKAPLLALDHDAQIISGRNFWLGASDPNIAPITVFKTANLSAEARFLLDGKNLHIQAKVRDDSVVTGGADRVVVRWTDPSGQMLEEVAEPVSADGGYETVFRIPRNSLQIQDDAVQLSILVYDGDAVVADGGRPYLIGSFAGGTLETPALIRVRLR
jgi:hypothetical protein